MAGLEEEIKQFLLERGAISVGFSNLDTLAGGPPSADLTYKLPEARSAVSFAMPYDRDKIRAYLGKQNYLDFETHNIDLNIKVTKVAESLQKWLEIRGYASKRIIANNNYRREIEGWQISMPPDISHRYLAVRSGAGSFGWSGNVGVKDYGTAILLGTVVTAADLEPTDPIPPEESFCDNCKICLAVCAAGMVEKKKETSVTLGGETFTFGARRNYMLCNMVCGGFTGLSKNGKWSTWSPGRHKIPDTVDNNELFQTLTYLISKYSKWPQRGDGTGGYGATPLKGMNVRLTCSNCQIACWGNREDTRENYKILRNSGCVLQRENGEIVVLPAEEAAEEFEKMDPAHRALYS